MLRKRIDRTRKEKGSSYRTVFQLTEEERAKKRPKNLNGGRPPSGASREQLAEWHRDMKRREEFRKLRQTANLELLNAVVAEAASRGLLVHPIFSDQGHWDGHSVLVEDKPCQIVRTKYHISNPRSPHAVSIQLYLPRKDWPDFMIYVLRQTIGPIEYYVLPRGVLSKDTALCPSTLAKYRDAWSLLKEVSSPDLLERRFSFMNWQLRKVVAEANRAGLEVGLIPKRSSRPHGRFCQTRVMIEDRRCTIHSLSRINPLTHRSSYFALRKPKGDWGEFQLYALPHSKEPVVYVIPSASIQSNTSVPLESERLAAYKNNWGLLARNRHPNP